MIIDRIENRAFYKQLNPRITTALEYLAKTDFTKLAVGKYEIDGPKVFAIVQRYVTKPLENIAWEAHREYIDLQYVAEGGERMGYAPLCNHIPIYKEYDPQRDLIFYHAQGDLLTVPAGSFAIFTPQDIHAPGLAVDPSTASTEVVKVVVKCLV